MKFSLKPLSQQVVVITGASSGIGLSAATLAARAGAKVVLAARNEAALAKICDTIRHAGGQAAYVATDVGRRENVQKIADKAMAEFGGLDTWVNDAGVGILGKLEDVSDEDSHRLFDTNFWGLVYGSLIAVKHFRTRPRDGYAGALINLGSEVSDVALPLQGMYSASKHAIKGFTNALRVELRKEEAPVSVTLIKPSAIGTNFFVNAKNYTGKAPKAPPPIYMPEEAGRAICFAAEHHRRDIYIGGAARIQVAMNSMFPRLADAAGLAMFKLQLDPHKAAQDTEGNLYQPAVDGAAMGPSGHSPRKSFYTRMVTWGYEPGRQKTAVNDAAATRAANLH